MAQNVYIHIPFCKQKCHYCSFISFVDLKLKSKYIEQLKSEITLHYQKEPLKTLYFGGGTPSILNIEDFETIITLFNITQNTEITVELNPENLNIEYLKGLKSLGVNRLSFGCQTFDDTMLKSIGRKHSSIDVVNAIELSNNVGFENLSVDLIYGLPAQNVKDFETDLVKAASMNIKHISLYGLKIDEGCYFATHPPAKLPDSDSQAEMYLTAIKILKNYGFEHYEISNFAQPNYQSKHNLNYWDNNSYYGFGIAAHGYISGIRYSNFEDFDNYFKSGDKQHLYEHEVTSQEQLEEEIFLGFRKMQGICVEAINTKYNIDFDQKYKPILDKYQYSGHLELEDNFYRLTESGILVSNTILADFIE